MDANSLQSGKVLYIGVKQKTQLGTITIAVLFLVLSLKHSTCNLLYLPPGTLLVSTIFNHSLFTAGVLNSRSVDQYCWEPGLASGVRACANFIVHV